MWKLDVRIITPHNFVCQKWPGKEEMTAEQKEIIL